MTTTAITTTNDDYDDDDYDDDDYDDDDYDDDDDNYEDDVGGILQTGRGSWMEFLLKIRADGKIKGNYRICRR